MANVYLNKEIEFEEFGSCHVQDRHVHYPIS